MEAAKVAAVTKVCNAPTSVDILINEIEVFMCFYLPEVGQK